MGGLMNEAESRVLTNISKLCLSVMEYYLTMERRVTFVYAVQHYFNCVKCVICVSTAFINKVKVLLLFMLH